ncbi:hypothetical protein OO013_11035 [Mangrovivirga sp. M17]|uniref:PKD domain-containing protein n=1 Tax=Mangrovivirga halotolerans TaxID=2993936 RepID=A0ABT3RS02_9BACT|nr:hypothetical protein [Mangrovivirga halotolerans]MCX2744405.1 hypothetical protein [Mangrovivirga halotolerans]
MKRSIKNIILLLIAIIPYFSCVDNDLDLPNDNQIQTTESTALLIFLNSYNELSGGVASDQITFVYPIYIAYTNGIVVEVTDEEGLNSILQSQSADFYVGSIKFPLEIDNAGSIQTVNNEKEFNILLKELGVHTFEEDFLNGFLQCFDFDYPTHVNDSTFETAGQFLDFMETKPDSVFLELNFPQNLLVYSYDSILTFNNEFEILELTNNCSGCPQLSYSIRTDSAFNYTFIADFPLKDSIPGYQWYINGEFIENDGIEYQGDNQLSKTFEPGEYSVCIAAITDQCMEGTQYCDTIFVKDPCPQLFFNITDSTNNNYTFSADFTRMDSTTYNWELYQNGDLLASEFEDGTGDNQFFFQFMPGTYNMCMKAETPECPQGTSYCKEIVVQ